LVTPQAGPANTGGIQGGAAAVENEFGAFWTYQNTSRKNSTHRRSQLAT